jgi:hypothetical protein
VGLCDWRTQEQHLKITYGTEHLTLDEFKRAYQAIPAGHTVIYATGALDTSRSIGPEGKEIDRVGKYAMHLANQGLVCLTQRAMPELMYRNGGGRCFEYRATKCEPKTSVLTRLPLNCLLAVARETA